MYSNAAEEKQLLTAYQGFARTHTHTGSLVILLQAYQRQ